MTLAAFSSGCHFRRAAREVVFPTSPILREPQTVQSPIVEQPMTDSRQAGAAATAPIVRGQDPGFGGHAIAAMPGESAVGPRYAQAPDGRYTVQQTQYQSPANPYPSNWSQSASVSSGSSAAGVGASPVFHAPGTGLIQPNAPPQTTSNLPYGATGQLVSQPPFMPNTPLYDPLAPGDVKPIDLDILLEEAQTGRLMFGVGVNSDAGVIGNIVIDEQNFDITRWPHGFRDLLGGAFRGNGQRFRLEALPGTQVQRYTASFSDPYIFNSPFSFGISGFYYDRFFLDWDEQRVGGRASLGWTFPERPDLSASVALRLEQIDIFNPRTPTPQALQEVIGNNDLMSVAFELSHDVRDNAFLPTEGHLIRLSFEQAFGTFTYPRFEADFRQYFVTYQRPDTSGRHVLGLAAKIGASGNDTPIYDHFFAGGFSTIRGFDFRGASPRIGRVVVGGEFQFLTSAEYRFPLTADDNLYGSFFIDAGTVEETSTITWTDVRVTPGFEMRINIPALGPVPLAIGLGVPIQHERGDRIRNFHFFVGISR